MLDRLVGLAAVVPFVVGTAAAPADPPSAVDLTFRDPAIVESSGLVVRGGLFVTANDSGDSGRIFVVDRTGETVGTTSWAAEPEDVEALAPAGPHSVWVGDLGDNTGSRDHVEVLRVPYGRGSREVDPASYSLVYPDGPHDAETLLANPRTGRLLVVSKDIFGGTVYAAPAQLSADRPNRLRPVADSLGFATDGSFFPDGRHYVLRDYGGASIYAFPGHERLGSFPLPAQRQGEGIAVDDSGAVHVSTEGQFTDVLRVRLPDDLAREVRPVPAPSPSPPAPSGRAGQPAEEPAGKSARDGGRPVWPWLVGGAAAIGFAAGIARLLSRHGAAA